MSQDEITRTYQNAAGRWTGCDWPTHFGALGLDLNGLTAEQARLMARATAGAEAADWRAAADWLAEVEEQARVAEAAAARAVRLAADGRLAEAAEQAKAACVCEGLYRPERVWLPLYDALSAVPAC